MLTTYVVPFIDGDMRRYIETNLGCLSLDRDDMAIVRNVQRPHHVEYMDADEIAAELNISEEEAVRHMNYATHFFGIDDLTAYYDDIDVYDHLLENGTTEDPGRIIYHRMRMEHFKELFDALPRKDKDILGKCYGVFGYQKEPLVDIAMYHFMKTDAVEKARDCIIQKLRMTYPGSMMQCWSRISRLLEYPDRLLEPSEHD